MDYLLVEAGAAAPIQWGLEIAKMVVPAFLSAALVLLGLWVWHLQKRSELKYKSLGTLEVEAKRLESLMKTWSLLAYLTEVENPKSVLRWEKQGDKTLYYVRPVQARAYMEELNRIFYECGCGLLLGPKVKELCYEYRGHLYGVLLRHRKTEAGDEKILLENPELVKRLKEIYDKLNRELKSELKKIEK